jgi:translation initiation factor IF-2
VAKKKETVIKPKSEFTPVVAVMGHVDHGKTSLLDRIRGTKVAASEAGGITQNTRAHQIEHKGQKMTFIDTPGHEAFSNMRARGAAVTDIVLLVVAADDGIQPQTKESIKFAKETGTPIIVAINKTDLPGLKLVKVKQALASFDVNIEEYGGDVLAFEVSALTGKGVEEMLDGIQLFAEINELKHPEIQHGENASAFVLESNTHKQLGAVALAIMQAGEIQKPLSLLSNIGITKPRALLSHEQKPISLVKAGDPFWVTGLKQPLEVGETIYFADSDAKLENVAEAIKKAEEQNEVAAEEFDGNKMLLQRLLNLDAQKAGSEQKQLNIIVKASSKGTLEVVTEQLKKLDSDERKINILEASTNEITETDINRAKLANGIVISFQREPSSSISRLASKERVIVRNYEVIYEMLAEVEAVLDSLVTPELEEIEIARARIKQLFTLTNGDVVYGCEVVKGRMLKGYRVYVERTRLSTDQAMAEIGRGKISSLRILKEEVREVKKGQECGIFLDTKIEDIEVGDEVVAYKLES